MNPHPSVWLWNDKDRTWVIHGRECFIWMDARPAHCDRGRWLARLEVAALGHRYTPTSLHVDGADLWPRYYFDLDRAKAEIEAWLRCRNQWVEPTDGRTAETVQPPA